jgi:FkbM family methyltransferase
MNLYRAFRRGTILRTLRGTEPFYWLDQQSRVVEFGTKFAQWAVDTSLLSASTTVLSAGLGDDVSFETDLINRFGCTVCGFDPTPASRQYITRHVTDPRFRTYAYALADYDGTLTFNLPPEASADLVNASAVADYGTGRSTVTTLPCLTLASAMQLCKIETPDILKMDIEGAEYAVLAQALANNWLAGVSQVLVEFHHFLPGLAAAQTRQSIAALQQAGFAIAWIGRTNHEYLFTRAVSARRIES